MKQEKNQMDIILPIVHPEIESYMRTLASLTDDSVLLEMEAFAKQQNFPIVNRLVGIFLATQAKMIQARRVFEFGSGYGYSAYWFAKAVGAKGQVICSDINPANRAAAEQYLASTDLWQRLNFQIGEAQDVFLSTEGMFDICYNDVDKEAYPEIWQMAKHRIRPGGLYIADNVLWNGRVITQNDVGAISGATKAIIKHNQMIFDDAEFETFINPTRDGVLVARRK
jgi:predicted O-methyltransferase YrrM